MTAGIKTFLTEALEIDYPIIGAPMFLVSYEQLTIAVSEAGGIGCFPLPNYRETGDLARALAVIRQATRRPVGVNIHLSGRFPWKAQLSLCLEAGVNFFITCLGDPGLIIDQVHAAGGLVFADVVNLEQGLKAKTRGVDGLVAVATGAGGHGGTMPVMVLVPYLLEKTGLPVVAAGGISTGAQMAAALALGACGVVVGTRLVATRESRASSAYKQAVVSAGPEEIVCTDRITGNRVNWIGSSIEDVAAGPAQGSRKWLDFWSAGQSVAQTESIIPAGEVVRQMATDCIGACGKLQTLFERDRLKGF